MKRCLLSFFLIFWLFGTFSNTYVSGEKYNLPGEDYNNIGIKAELYVDLNVTLVNTAPFPKFVIVNPRYGFVVLRKDYDEKYFPVILGNETYYVLNSPQKTTLNYYIGFWVQPYETVTVRLFLSSNNSYDIKLSDYVLSSCSNNKITEVQFNESKFIGGKVQTPERLSPAFCGVVYPQLLNAPMFIDIQDVLQSGDGYIKILKYSGVVTLKLTNVPNRDGSFKSLFAIALPVIFKDAVNYGFNPEYTMKYSEYVDDFLPEYLGIEPKTNEQIKTKPKKAFNLYKLSNNLISGVKMISPKMYKPTIYPLDYPVWIVWLGSSPLEIKYHVSWNNDEKVNAIEGQREKAFWFVLDRRNPE